MENLIVIHNEDTNEDYIIPAGSGKTREEWIAKIGDQPAGEVENLLNSVGGFIRYPTEGVAPKAASMSSPMDEITPKPPRIETEEEWFPSREDVVNTAAGNMSPGTAAKMAMGGLFVPAGAYAGRVAARTLAAKAPQVMQKLPSIPNPLLNLYRSQAGEEASEIIGQQLGSALTAGGIELAQSGSPADAFAAAISVGGSPNVLKGDVLKSIAKGTVVDAGIGGITALMTDRPFVKNMVVNAVSGSPGRVMGGILNKLGEKTQVEKVLESSPAVESKYGTTQQQLSEAGQYLQRSFPDVAGEIDVNSGRAALEIEAAKRVMEPAKRAETELDLLSERPSQEIIEQAMGKKADELTKQGLDQQTVNDVMALIDWPEEVQKKYTPARIEKVNPITGKLAALPKAPELATALQKGVEPAQMLLQSAKDTRDEIYSPSDILRNDIQNKEVIPDIDIPGDYGKNTANWLQGYLSKGLLGYADNVIVEPKKTVKDAAGNPVEQKKSITFGEFEDILSELEDTKSKLYSDAPKTVANQLVKIKEDWKNRLNALTADESIKKYVNAKLEADKKFSPYRNKYGRVIDIAKKYVGSRFKEELDAAGLQAELEKQAITAAPTEGFREFIPPETVVAGIFYGGKSPEEIYTGLQKALASRQISQEAFNKWSGKVEHLITPEGKMLRKVVEDDSYKAIEDGIKKGDDIAVRTLERVYNMGEEYRPVVNEILGNVVSNVLSDTNNYKTAKFGNREQRILDDAKILKDLERVTKPTGSLKNFAEDIYNPAHEMYSFISKKQKVLDTSLGTLNRFFDAMEKNGQDPGRWLINNTGIDSPEKAAAFVKSLEGNPQGEKIRDSLLYAAAVEPFVGPLGALSPQDVAAEFSSGKLSEDKTKSYIGKSIPMEAMEILAKNPEQIAKYRELKKLGTGFLQMLKDPQEYSMLQYMSFLARGAAGASSVGATATSNAIKAATGMAASMQFLPGGWGRYLFEGDNVPFFTKMVINSIMAPLARELVKKKKENKK